MTNNTLTRFMGTGETLKDYVTYSRGVISIIKRPLWPPGNNTWVEYYSCLMTRAQASDDIAAPQNIKRWCRRKNNTQSNKQ